MKVFFTQKQNVENNDSYSPSAGKPAKVLAAWMALGLPIEVVEPQPATLEDLGLAHDPFYAGGYQKDFAQVLELHNNTARMCVEIFEGNTIATPVETF